MSRRNPKRKTSGGRFARLPISVLAHPAVVTLDHAPFRVLVLLAAQFNGYNNGALGLSKQQAAQQNISNKTLYKALRTLESHGLIEMTYPASRVPPRPTMYALTWISMDDTSYSKSARLPTHSYKEWQPPRKPKLKIVSERTHATG